MANPFLPNTYYRLHGDRALMILPGERYMYVHPDGSSIEEPGDHPQGHGTLSMGDKGVLTAGDEKGWGLIAEPLTAQPYVKIICPECGEEFNLFTRPPNAYLCQRCEGGKDG